jgi:hypothetical protein
VTSGLGALPRILRTVRRSSAHGQETDERRHDTSKHNAVMSPAGNKAGMSQVQSGGSASAFLSSPACRASRVDRACGADLCERHEHERQNHQPAEGPTGCHRHRGNTLFVGVPDVNAALSPKPAVADQ